MKKKTKNEKKIEELEKNLCDAFEKLAKIEIMKAVKEKINEENEKNLNKKISPNNSKLIN